MHRIYCGRFQTCECGIAYRKFRSTSSNHCQYIISNLSFIRNSFSPEFLIQCLNWHWQLRLKIEKAVALWKLHLSLYKHQMIFIYLLYIQYIRMYIRSWIILTFPLIINVFAVTSHLILTCTNIRMSYLYIIYAAVPQPYKMYISLYNIY